MVFGAESIQDNCTLFIVILYPILIIIEIMFILDIEYCVTCAVCTYQYCTWFYYFPFMYNIQNWNIIFNCYPNVDYP